MRLPLVTILDLMEVSVCKVDEHEAWAHARQAEHEAEAKRSQQRGR